ncbi:MAG: hypothetical protein PF442_04960 [Desulfobulbaceae bacterium]|jgi:CheY-like chemotaxis protein|nr:hypothetical protein [Desulfobulbaceae bacterium]
MASKLPIEIIDILLVEDNPGDARLVQEMLKEGMGQPWSLITADTLAQGLAVINNDGIDLVDPA